MAVCPQGKKPWGNDGWPWVAFGSQKGVSLPCSRVSLRYLETSPRATGSRRMMGESPSRLSIAI